MAEPGPNDEDRKLRPTQATIITVSAGSLVGLAIFLLRFCSFEGLSELLTLIYQASWVALVVHHGCHIYAGYFRTTGLPREAALELLFVLAWGAVAVGIGLLDDPKLLPLAAVWIGSAYALFHLSTDMEEAREQLFEAEGRRLRRASDVIRESGIWLGFRSRVLQVEDPRAHGVLEMFPETDSEDGKLTRMIWTAICSMVAIGLIATTAAAGQVLLKSDEPPAGSGVTEKGGGGGSAPDTTPEVNTRRRGGREQEEGREPEGSECGGRRDPGGRMPGPIRRSLSLAWHDVEGLDPGLMEALDYDIGGCPGPARPIPGLKGDWYAPGYCEGDLTMLSIAFEGIDHPVVLLEQAADFALPMIRQGRFVSAEDRFTIGEGDAYVINSRDGSYVPIRDTASSGRVEGSGDGDGGCGDFIDEDVAYAVAGPGLLDPWRSVAAISPGGVYPIDVATDGPSRPRLALRSTATGILTMATCDAPLLTCELRLGEETYTGSPGAHITSTEVQALAEP
jgi:hypothetical protein